MVMTVTTTDTFEPLVGATVEFQVRDEAIDDYRTERTLTTGAGGQVRFVYTLPTEVGRHRFRALVRQTDDFRADRSDILSLEVVRVPG